MIKLWCIAVALGDPDNGMVVVSTQVGGLQEMAVAQAVSEVYRQTGTKLSLMGANARELTREYLELVLKAMDEDEDEAKPPSVVQLVPTTPHYVPDDCNPAEAKYDQ